MIRILSILLMFCTAVQAEERVYGDVYLNDLARKTSWPYNAVGETYVMVCNVNGPDGYLSVRSGPGTDYEVRRNLKRLAIVTVDTSQRRGNWVRVLTANRTHSTDGYALSEYRDLHVSGWAHDSYLCDFQD